MTVMTKVTSIAQIGEQWYVSTRTFNVNDCTKQNDTPREVIDMDTAYTTKEAARIASETLARSIDTVYVAPETQFFDREVVVVGAFFDEHFMPYKVVDGVMSQYGPEYNTFDAAVAKVRELVAQFPDAPPYVRCFLEPRIDQSNTLTGRLAQF